MRLLFRAVPFQVETKQVKPPQKVHGFASRISIYGVDVTNLVQTVAFHVPHNALPCLELQIVDPSRAKATDEQKEVLQHGDLVIEPESVPSPETIIPINIDDKPNA